MYSTREGRPREAPALAGLPALIIPVDFTCRTVCGSALTIASAALAESRLRPGNDFKLLVIGLDPRDSVAQAGEFVLSRVEPAIANEIVIAQGDRANTDRLLSAIGFHAVYDAESDQFAHPAAALVVAPDGRIARTLGVLGLNARDLRLTLIGSAASAASPIA